MGSFGGENMDQFDFDPSQGRLVPKCDEKADVRASSEQLYKRGVELEFDPVQSRLVPKKEYENGTVRPTVTEQAYLNGQEFDFDPTSSRLVPEKKENIDQVEQQLRHPSQKQRLAFDKGTKGIKVEEVKEKSRARQSSDRKVKVDMNRRGTGGFF